MHNHKETSKKNQKEFQLPYTNREVGHTLENGLRACVDWVEATLFSVSPAQLISEILLFNPDSFSIETGQFGYRHCLRNGKISIYYDGREDMGIHLEIKGRGCREYESSQKRSWKELFAVLLSNDASFTRIDIAVDDFKGFFTIKSMVRRIKNEELVSKFKQARNVENIEIRTGEVRGVTLYFGSSKSDIQIRMYDKLSERLDTNYRVPEDITFWNRTEVQARNKKAQEIAEILAKEDQGEISIGKTVCGILKYYLRFTVKSKDTNKSRWKTAPFWEKFLAGVDELPLTTITGVSTIEDKENWLRRNAAPSLAVVYEAYSGDMEQIEKFIYEGLARLKAKDYDMINQFKALKTATAGSNTINVTHGIHYQTNIDTTINTDSFDMQ
ncbi:replication initiation factor domain-containing protein [Schinkia azotoformans]|uniref:replication initiation factor domain-containing protein n=1 Tax=Schinkia azotoformans TaxID=1454 RepID=UPI002E2303D6|nr:replication initiation factor domain-containing protein [Schinkia azotoformans]MED4351733.1 replication initiation factor domain-containing protein [Schinkia azotoformans]